jgi:hypothetical protein
MIDITRLLVHARTPAWSRDVAADLLTDLAEATGLTAEWNDDAGQDWAILRTGKRWRALVCMTLPLVITVRDDVPVPDTVTRVVVPSLDRPDLTCRAAVLRRAADRLGAHVNPARFAASDLWAATV